MGRPEGCGQTDCGRHRSAKLALHEWFGANQRMIEMLGRYNSEKARGLVHTAEWAAKMEVNQELYDERVQQAMEQEQGGSA